MSTPAVAPDLQELAVRIVRESLGRGASAAECVVRSSRELSVTVRLGETESVKQAEGKALGIRVFRGQQAGTVYSSDLSWSAVEPMIASALAIAENASSDPFAGLPAPEEQGSAAADLELYSERAAAVTPDQAIAWAREAERAALDCDPRLGNSDGGSFDAGESTRILANSNGFLGAVRGSSCSLAAVPIATQDGKMQRDYWYTVARSPEELESPASVGRTAARRTLRRLGARKIPTTKVPVVFDPQAARSLLGHLLEAVSGEAVYREASFLKGKLGELVAAPEFTLVDDGLRPRGLGSSPFDAEGVPSRRTVVINEGRLHSYLLNCYAARKLGLRTTGNAARGLAGAPGVSCGNLTLQPGTATPEEIIASVPRGLYVTEFIGFGVNLVTGDYSRGASGLWIENGELAYPVEEITLAGNLAEMFRNVRAIGSDLVYRGAVTSPTLLIEGLTLAGS
ncbi:MAG TPA: metallopeptidase TldD-related protein [Terriglobales bacterium]|nr:metallopeptidase TldD-related protein [Terriglobales bacterium]